MTLSTALKCRFLLCCSWMNCLRIFAYKIKHIHIIISSKSQKVQKTTVFGTRKTLVRRKSSLGYSISFLDASKGLPHTTWCAKCSLAYHEAPFLPFNLCLHQKTNTLPETHYHIWQMRNMWWNGSKIRKLSRYEICSGKFYTWDNIIFTLY